MRSRVVAAIVALVLSIAVEPPASAQSGLGLDASRLSRDGYSLSKADAERLETTLQTQPDDLPTRTKLLGYYFRNGVKQEGAQATIANRRRHILWIIERHPDSSVAALASATIDPSGHVLADTDGYDRAVALWAAIVEKPNTRPVVLGNEARFVQLSDKPRAVALLERARIAESDNGEWSTRLGFVYGLAVLGVNGLNQNGLPTSHDPTEAAGEFAKGVRKILEVSTDAPVIAVAGTIIGKHGLMLSGILGPRFKVDHVALSDSFLVRAQALSPNNSSYNAAHSELVALRAMASKK